MVTENFEAGQEVIILPGGWGKTAPVPAQIVKVARVWMDVESEGEGFPSRWRIRKDTQNEGNQDYPQCNARLYTLGQWAEYQREKEAELLLAEQGIEIRYSSPWYRRKTELADLIRKAITDGQE